MITMFDLVYYQKNFEEGFISVACQLNYKGLVFLHSLHDFVNISSKNILVLNAITCSAADVVRARKLAPLVFVQSSAASGIGDDRLCIERARPDGIFGFCFSSHRDFMHQRNSGLNNVLCSLMHQKDVAYVIDYRSVLGSPAALGRLLQNISLCKKYKVSLVAGSFARHPLEMRGAADILALFSLLGLNGRQAKDALSSVSLIAKNNLLRKSGKLPADGVREV